MQHTGEKAGIVCFVQHFNICFQIDSNICLKLDCNHCFQIDSNICLKFDCNISTNDSTIRLKDSADGKDQLVAGWLFSSEIFSVQGCLGAGGIFLAPRSHESCCGQYVMCIFRREGGRREWGGRPKGGEGPPRPVGWQAPACPQHLRRAAQLHGFHTLLPPQLSRAVSQAEVSERVNDHQVRGWW